MGDTTVINERIETVTAQRGLLASLGTAAEVTTADRYLDSLTRLREAVSGASPPADRRDACAQ